MSQEMGYCPSYGMGPVLETAAVLFSVDQKSALESSGRVVPVLPLAQVGGNVDFCLLNRWNSLRSAAGLTHVFLLLLIFKSVSDFY